jgi:hypothetical protein
MKFLCLAYGDEKDWRALSKEEQDELLAQDDLIRKRGALMGAAQTAVTTVRAPDGRPITSNRSFARTELSFAGFSIIDADSLDEVIQLVAKTPCARANGAIEIRPITAINDDAWGQRTSSSGFRLAAVLANGLLAGASLDQSVKQLRARKTIGAMEYSKYSRAADLGNGIPFYAVLGLGAAALTIAMGWEVPGRVAKAALVTSILHSLTTVKAAPIIHSQRNYRSEKVLSRVFDRFERWQAFRLGLQLATFGLSAIALQKHRA